MRTLILATLTFMAGCSTDSITFIYPDMAVGAGVDMATGAPMDAMVGTCDLTKQDCPTGAKCVRVNVGTQMMPVFAGQCVAIATNPAGLNQTCTRTMGMDNCDKGLLCSTVNAPTGMRTCLKICGAASDCASTEKCIAGFGGGVCVTPCTVFGSNCKAGMTCASFQTDIASTMDNVIVVPTCRTIGTTPIGGDCMRGSDCVANTGCGTDTGTCLGLCNTGHACPAGADGGVLQCLTLVDTTDIGICE